MSVLLDTSVWIHHFKRNDPHVVQLLEEQRVVVHEFVIAELACSSLKSRTETLRYLSDMPMVQPVSTDEVMSFIEGRKLYSRGIGLVDVQLLGSVVLSGNATLWTRDKRLGEVAGELGLGYQGSDQ